MRPGGAVLPSPNNSMPGCSSGAALSAIQFATGARYGSWWFDPTPGRHPAILEERWCFPRRRMLVCLFRAGSFLFVVPAGESPAAGAACQRGGPVLMLGAMKITACDRCGEQEGRGLTAKCIPVKYGSVSTNVWDLCRVCFGELKAWLERPKQEPKYSFDPACEDAVRAARLRREVYGEERAAEIERELFGDGKEPEHAEEPAPEGAVRLSHVADHRASSKRILDECRADLARHEARVAESTASRKGS